MLRAYCPNIYTVTLSKEPGSLAFELVHVKLVQTKLALCSIQPKARIIIKGWVGPPIWVGRGWITQWQKYLG